MLLKSMAIPLQRGTTCKTPVMIRLEAMLVAVTEA